MRSDPMLPSGKPDRSHLLSRDGPDLPASVTLSTRLDRKRVICVLLASSLAPMLPMSPVLGCDDPAQHPGMAAFLALAESLPPQLNTPIHLRYKVTSSPSKALNAQVELSFWNIADYSDGSLAITASEGATLSSLAMPTSLPHRDSMSFAVSADTPGHYHLRSQISVKVGGKEITSVALIPVPLGQLHDEASPTGIPPERGFSGLRFRSLIER